MWVLFAVHEVGQPLRHALRRGADAAAAAEADAAAAAAAAAAAEAVMQGRVWVPFARAANRSWIGRGGGWRPQG